MPPNFTGLSDGNGGVPKSHAFPILLLHGLSPSTFLHTSSSALEAEVILRVVWLSPENVLVRAHWAPSAELSWVLADILICSVTLGKWLILSERSTVASLYRGADSQVPQRSLLIYCM